MIAARLIPRDRVEAALRERGCRILAEVPDGTGGRQVYWLSQSGVTFVLRLLPPDLMCPAVDFGAALAMIQGNAAP